MHQNGHFGAALLVYAPLGFAVAAAGFQTLALVGGVVTVTLATLPDVDHHLPGVAHRGPTHTLWFAVLVGLVVAVAGLALTQSDGHITAGAVAVFGFLVGTLSICSHVAADAITPMGVRPWTPFSDRHYSYGLVRAKNPVANWLLLAAGVGAAGAAYGLALTV